MGSFPLDYMGSQLGNHSYFSKLCGTQNPQVLSGCFVRKAADPTAAGHPNAAGSPSTGPTEPGAAGALVLCFVFFFAGPCGFLGHLLVLSPPGSMIIVHPLAACPARHGLPRHGGELRFFFGGVLGPRCFACLVPNLGVGLWTRGPSTSLFGTCKSGGRFRGPVTPDREVVFFRTTSMSIGLDGISMGNSC